MKLNISNTFCENLPADPILKNFVRQVENACYSFAMPTKTEKPEVIHFSEETLENIGLQPSDAASIEFLNIFSGNAIYPDTKPFAMCYGGHQFGTWAGQLGDGRAINLFEINHKNQQLAVQLKGAGETPYSRSADGLAVLRSSVREYLCSEAMHHLGVPTTRALSLMLTGDYVTRDVLYNGNPADEKGAVVCRVAPSFIRFGNFQILAARNDFENLKKLTDYTIGNFFPHLGKPSKETYLNFFEEVCSKTIEMVVHWERIGFVHGVMNTDNMSILGLTIDYGPYGWLEKYEPSWTPNTTDYQHKRYRYENQSDIAFWNILQLANALYALVGEAKPLETILDNFEPEYYKKHTAMMLSKLGLTKLDKNLNHLIQLLKTNLQESEMDMTLFYRKLSDFDVNNIDGFVKSLAKYSYAPDFVKHEIVWKKWFIAYAIEITAIDNIDRKKEMDLVNPKYIFRNYMAHLAIEAADNKDFSVIAELFELLKKPYDEQLEQEKWFVKQPEWAKQKVGCSALSCSS